MPKLTPHIWFDDAAEAAAEFYCSLFPNSRITHVARYTEAGPGEAGSVLTVSWELDGHAFVGINGGPEFRPSPAISFLVDCGTQEEIDHYWDALSVGGREYPCGWVEDRYGVSWQVIPRQLIEYLTSTDPETAKFATQAMHTMRKIDLAAIEDAAKAAI